MEKVIGHRFAKAPTGNRQEVQFPLQERIFSLPFPFSFFIFAFVLMSWCTERKTEGEVTRRWWALGDIEKFWREEERDVTDMVTEIMLLRVIFCKELICDFDTAEVHDGLRRGDEWEGIVRMDR